MAILHSVFFYFNENTSADIIEAQKLAILNRLSTISEVKWVKAGAPFGIQRDVVDNTYGMSLHLEVASKADLDVYQSHPTHIAFIQEFKPYWSGIKVYDTSI